MTVQLVGSHPAAPRGMNSVWQMPTTTSSVGSDGVPLLFCTSRVQVWSGPQSLFTVQVDEQ